MLTGGHIASPTSAFRSFVSACPSWPKYLRLVGSSPRKTVMGAEPGLCVGSPRSTRHVLCVAMIRASRAYVATSQECGPSCLRASLATIERGEGMSPVFWNAGKGHSCCSTHFFLTNAPHLMKCLCTSSWCVPG